MGDATELHAPELVEKDPKLKNPVVTDGFVHDNSSSAGNGSELDSSEGTDDDDDGYNEHRLAFILFDHDRDLRLNFEELKHAVRSLGVIATEEEFEDFKHTSSDSSGFDYADFLAAAARLHNKAVRRADDYFKSNDVIAVLTECFARIDSEGTGFVSLVELRRILTTFGEPLTQSEFDSFVDTSNLVTDDKVQYSKLIDLLLSNPFRSVE